MDDVNAKLRALVDDLPTESLDMYVTHYEDGMVGGYYAYGCPPDDRGWQVKPSNPDAWTDPGCRCPRASMGFGAVGLRCDGDRSGVFCQDSAHPADVIETMALDRKLDPAALYSECVLALMEREAELAAPTLAGAVR